MADHRIVLIENPARLSIDHGRLRIERDGQDDVFASPADIAVVCLHHHTVSVSVNALKALAASGAVVLVTDDQHNPCAMMTPLVANQALPQRLHDQIAMMDKPQADECWAQIVRAKIGTQAANLRHFELNGALRLERLVSEVKLADKGNAEAQAAKHYWRFFFGNEFTRNKEGATDALNARLNYGYAVLRSLIARQLVMSGLNPALGIGHRSKQNPFNLADDFTEPFRYLVDRHIRTMVQEPAELTPPVKAGLLRFMEQEVEMGGQSYRLSSAVMETVASYCRVLENQGGTLRLP